MVRFYGNQIVPFHMEIEPHKLTFLDVAKFTPTESLNKFSISEPSNVSPNFLQEIPMEHLIRYSYATQRSNGCRGDITEIYSPKIFIEIARRIALKKHLEQFLFLKDNDYLCHDNLEFAVKIVARLRTKISTPYLLAEIENHLEEKEHKILFWKLLFDYYSTNSTNIIKQYALSKFLSCVGIGEKWRFIVTIKKIGNNKRTAPLIRLFRDFAMAA